MMDTIEGLEQEGWVAMLKAYQQGRTSKGFDSYIYKAIRHRMWRFICRNYFIVRQPNEKKQHDKQFIAKYESTYGVKE